MARPASSSAMRTRWRERWAGSARSIATGVARRYTSASTSRPSSRATNGSMSGRARTAAASAAAVRRLRHRVGHVRARRVGSASADLTRSVVLKAGNAFIVSEPDGEMPIGEDHAFGVYRDETRFLSGHELRLAHQRARLLVVSAPTGVKSVHELTNPDLELPGDRRLALQTVRIRVDRRWLDDSTLEERIHVHLYGREPVELDVTLALAADFRPMLALRGIAELPPPRVRVDGFERGVCFAARGS